MVKTPPYLKPGDVIGLTCPAGYMSLEKVQTCIETLNRWGYGVKTGKTIGNDNGTYFSATDKDRLADFQQLLDDDSVRAILCARGGFGLSRIVDDLRFKSFKKRPKWIIGFSDVTVLHSHIYTNFGIATLHAPMAAAFNEEGYTNPYILSLKAALEGKKAKYEHVTHTFNHTGTAIGEVIGGNLTLITHLIGTASEMSTRGKILFLEDIGEYLYNIDRMFWQLRRSGKLQRLAGLIIGGFTDSKDTERPFGKTAQEIIHEHTRHFKFPVAFDFPVSHSKENYAIKHGVGYKLRVGKNKVVLEE